MPSTIPVRQPVRLLHASDTHLHWEQAVDALWCIEALRGAAEEHGAHAVLVAGDIFDTANQPAEFLATVAEQLNRFTSPVVLLPGNHDIRYADTEPDTLRLLGDLLRADHHVIEDPLGESVDLLDGAVHLWGRGMPEHTPTNDPLAGVAVSPDPASWSVAIAHGEVVINSARRSSPIDLQKHRANLEGIDYLALGHHDEPSVIDFEPALVCYSGSASRTLGAQTFALASLESSGVSVEIHSLRSERNDAASQPAMTVHQ